MIANPLIGMASASDINMASSRLDLAKARSLY